MIRVESAGWILLLALLSGLAACGGDPPPPPSGGGSAPAAPALLRPRRAPERYDTALVAAMDRAIAGGLSALIAVPAASLGDLHTLARVQAILPREEVAAFIARERERFRNDLYRGLLFPELEPVPLLPMRPPGYALLTWYLQHAVTKADPARSKDVLSEYLARDATGYILCHQVYAVLWLRETGLPDPEGLGSRLPLLLDRIEDELAGDWTFSDLNAERVAVLLAADPSRTCPAAWVRALLAGQTAGGWFRDGTVYRVEFDGETRELPAADSHATCQALFALAEARRRQE